MTTEIFLVRHGQPVLQNALLGSTDSPLSELGWLQLNESFSKLVEIDSIVSSSLSRCASFAQNFAEENDVNLIIDGAWRECHFGQWDGQSYQQLHQKYPQQVSQFFSDPDQFPPPGGESLKAFSERVEKALKNLVMQHSGQRIAVVTHAGVIRTLVAWCLKMDYASGLHFRRFAVDYASITHLSIYQDDKFYPQLLGLNQRPELAEVTV
ncbi:histidine phosphatase family protein [Aliikangiella coralliicola]|uniref:Histidine phosphatase family protein n=1 Tax=Aliikangiella coralliicola TaxID=2592383 RepID=A0A545UJI0_9GAMM|nr:histidine phosphatase family protein [Aliikangiella coralliicola]TQV89621.1 histidine phosphatase family protein [Aliikangiella coralliicola]